MACSRDSFTYLLRNRVAQLYPQALGSLFVASYDSQGYGGGILTRLHTGKNIVYTNDVNILKQCLLIGGPWTKNGAWLD
jgi:restriction endonuclease Mrr